MQPLFLQLKALPKLQITYLCSYTGTKALFNYTILVEKVDSALIYKNLLSTLEIDMSLRIYVQECYSI